MKLAVALRPGASQSTSWRGAHRYRPYEHKDKKPYASSADHSAQQQPWRQFRSRGRGRGRGGNPRFSKSHQRPNNNFCLGSTPIKVSFSWTLQKFKE